MNIKQGTGSRLYQRLWTASRRIVFITGALLLFSCSQSDERTDALSNTAVTFNAGITATRTTTGGDFWATTDNVGIFMVATGGSLNTPADVLANNVKHTVANATTGALSPTSGNPIYYPQSGNVDFIAYYPHGTVTADYKYNISVAGQTTESAQNALDVLYAKEANKVKSQTAVGLSFDHVLSKITLNITLGDGLTTLTGNDITEVAFSGMPQTATLTLQDGTFTAGTTGQVSALKAATPAGTNDATFTAILVPQAADDYPNRKVTFTVNGYPYEWIIPDGTAFNKGINHTYPVTVKKTGITVGAPTIADWATIDHGTGSAEEIGASIAKVRIPVGTFLMGASDGSNYPTYTIGDAGLNTTPAEPDREINETQHKVTLTKDFYMSKYQITVTQYTTFLNASGIGENRQYLFSDYGVQTLFTVNQYGWTPQWNSTESRWEGIKDTPMIEVTWYGALAYARWVGGTLPTEAQWEYACRAGTTTAYSFGDDASVLGDYAWYSNNSSTIQGPSPVGTRPPNTWGLYDMHGNVFEWCLDQWDGSNNYLSLSETDPLCTTGSGRVLRGGGWSDSAQRCRSAYRGYSDLGYGDLGYGDLNYGFRVVFVP